jgi:hypothetical protein
MATEIVVRTAAKTDEWPANGWVVSETGVLTVKVGTDEFVASYAPGHWFSVHKVD